MLYIGIARMISDIFLVVWFSMIKLFKGHDLGHDIVAVFFGICQLFDLVLNDFLFLVISVKCNGAGLRTDIRYLPVRFSRILAGNK